MTTMNRLVLKRLRLNKARDDLVALKKLSGQGNDLKKVYEACGIMFSAKPGRCDRFIDFCIGYVDAGIAGIITDLFDIED